MTMTPYAGTAEAADPYCLRDGEAAALLRGHPWRRFVVVGDSIAEGVGDPQAGYTQLGWADRVAAELAAAQPELTTLNLGRRDLRTAQVRRDQVEPAVAFKPDLALVACGGNDAMRPGFDPEAVDRDLAAIVTSLRGAGADVLTFALVVMADYPAFPEWFRPTAVRGMHLLAGHTNALAARLGTIHADLSRHPLGAWPEQLLSSDGLHANARNHAICAAEAVRRLGAHLGNTFPPDVA
jgi:lysophospholipase L1-like esterase